MNLFQSVLDPQVLLHEKFPQAFVEIMQVE